MFQLNLGPLWEDSPIKYHVNIKTNEQWTLMNLSYINISLLDNDKWCHFFPHCHWSSNSVGEPPFELVQTFVPLDFLGKCVSYCFDPGGLAKWGDTIVVFNLKHDSLFIGKILMPLGCYTLKGDIPNKYPLYKVCTGLIIKGPPSQGGFPPFSRWLRSPIFLNARGECADFGRFFFVCVVFSLCVCVCVSVYGCFWCLPPSHRDTFASPSIL